MSSSFLCLSRTALLDLASALEQERLKLPIISSALNGLVASHLYSDIESELNHLYSSGANATHIAYTLKMMAAERSAAQEERDKFDIVWTGQTIPSSVSLLEVSRDTSIVVRELFASAKKSVLISSYALDKGDKARDLFKVLADKMDSDSKLVVRMFLNVNRKYGNKTSSSILLREFAETFRKEIWPGNRLPQVFHDPRSLSIKQETRACLHAKCVVVDDEKLFVTSANFTEAAHERNIEAGVLIADSWAATAMQNQFLNLVTNNILLPLPGI
ncbi:MAG: DISARM system phospholipase D-like protein DrmC [Cyanobacteriota bacterium ELA615]|jgi:hypothetical protein